MDLRGVSLNTYQKVAVSTVVATLFLIFVGGLIRAAGAGLGCPDWPTCFGMWIPPTSAADLPAVYEASDFNLFKTWAEYINRLVGVVIGLLIAATFALSFRYRESDPPVFYSSTAAFVMVLIQGWLGGQVVITGLDAWLITLHMLLAMLIITVLLYAVFRSSSRLFTVSLDENTARHLFWAGAVLMGFTLIQLVVGTQVREAVDVVKDAVNPPPRELWLDKTGQLDEWHRTLSWTVFLSGLWVAWVGWWRTGSALISKLAMAILVVILFQIALGTGLYYLAMPPAYQVFHLVGSALLISLNVLLLLILHQNVESLLDRGD